MVREHTRSGFLLIQMLVAVGLLCILVMLTSTNFTFLNRFFLHAEVERLYQACVYARQCALATGQPHTITFDLDNKGYVVNGRQEQLAKGITIGFLPGSKGPPSSPIKLI